MDYDVVVIGGGIGGSGCATVLARAGLQILVLEPTTEYPDIVRGEWIAPWGVVETRSTGLYDVFVEAGGHTVSRHITFDEDVDGHDAMSTPLPLNLFAAGVAGPLCIRHPVACQALADAAEIAGATVCRGATNITLRDGVVRYQRDGTHHEARPRLVVGADGRASPLRNSLGIELEKARSDHYLGGLLVDGLDWWDDQAQGVATENGDHVLLFPQGGGRARMYLAFAANDRNRFAGRDRADEYLRTFQMNCWPGSEAFAAAKVIGPARSYGSTDTWTPTPYVRGAPAVVFIGDAAGYNDPIIGQGLSITNRDIRLVTEALLASDNWDDPTLFDEYATERVERMRRLRTSAQVYAISVAALGRGRDRDLRQRFREDASATLVVAAPMCGPHVIPAEAYDDVEERLLNASSA